MLEREEREVEMRVERRDRDVVESARCWNWKGTADFDAVFGVGVDDGAKIFEAEGVVVGACSLGECRNGVLRCACVCVCGCARPWVLWSSCIVFSSVRSKAEPNPRCLLPGSVMYGCRRWTLRLAWLGRSGLGDLGWKEGQAANGVVR